MPETYNLLINAGVAGVFAVFALVLIREFMKFISEQSVMWRTFLKEESDERTRLTIDTTKKMEKLDETLEELCLMVRNGREEKAKA